MSKVIAKRYILYRGRQYKTGDTICEADPSMVALWLSCDSVVVSGGGVDANGSNSDGQSKPLEKMNRAELEKFAATLDIDATKAANKAEAIEMIRAAQT